MNKIQIQDLRRYKETTIQHKDFEFVSKYDDWDFCISSSPVIVRSKDYFIEKNGKFCTYFISDRSANADELFETFNTIAWQSKEAKALLSGSRFPVADKEDIVKIYDLFLDGLLPPKRGDWRKQKERARYRKKHEYRT